MRVRWHHQLNAREFEQTPGDSERQGSWACCSPRGRSVGRDLVAKQQQQHKLDPGGQVMSIQIGVQERDFAGGTGCRRVHVPDPTWKTSGQCLLRKEGKLLDTI